jgi:hypothetical protein
MKGMGQPLVYPAVSLLKVFQSFSKPINILDIDAQVSKVVRYTDSNRDTMSFLEP